MSDDKDLEIEARLLSGLLAILIRLREAGWATSVWPSWLVWQCKPPPPLRRAASEDKEDG